MDQHTTVKESNHVEKEDVCHLGRSYVVRCRVLSFVIKVLSAVKERKLTIHKYRAMHFVQKV
jgi:hypothetical protein